MRTGKRIDAANNLNEGGGVMKWTKEAMAKAELAEQYAIENYKHGLNCAESVLEALVRVGELDISREAIGMCGFRRRHRTIGLHLWCTFRGGLANGIRYGRKDPYMVEDGGKRRNRR